MYDDFLKNLKTAVTNISVYFKDHPLVTKSIDGLKESINKIFSSVDVLEIKIAADYLIIGKLSLKEGKMYKDTATFFHLRKIKSIEVKKEVSSVELQSFLEQVSLPPNDILTKGGLAVVLEKAGVSNIIVKNLDYSELLTGEGKECKDAWVSLLSDSLAEGNAQKINELSKFSHKMLEGVSINDLTQDNQKRMVLAKFFNYLQDSDRDKFFESSKDLSKSIFKSDISISPESEMRLRNFLNNIDAKGISDVLIERFQGKEEFNHLSLDLFAKIVSEEKHGNIASFLLSKLGGEEKLMNNPDVVKNIKQLFVLPGSEKVSEIYKRNLLEIFENISSEENVSFDYGWLQKNYCFILLELFMLEKDEEKLKDTLDCILLEIKKDIDENKFSYIQQFINLLEKKQLSNNSLDGFCRYAYEKVANFVEKAMLNEGKKFLSTRYANIVKAGSANSEEYLKMIFEEEEFNSNALFLFFYVFPNNINQFYNYLNESLSNVILIKKIVNGVQILEYPLSIRILKHIFNKSFDLIKSEVLKIMQRLVSYDKQFVLSVIKNGNFIQRKQALVILLKDSDSLMKAAKILLDIKNYFGINSRIIKENLQIVREIPFKESQKYLSSLSKYHFFWNKDIRKLAVRVLSKI